MIETLATLVFGPLVVPECRRATGRGWIILVRTLAGSALLLTALAFLWWWWFNAQLPPEPNQPAFQPYATLRTGLIFLEVMGLVLALVMAPAVMAGSLAGEKERGSLGLLLTTRVSAREIVLGRLAGKLCQVGTIVAAGLPALVLLAGLAGLRAPAALALLVLLGAVGFGAGGIAAAASAVSRRGRDALLSVYLLILMLLFLPLLAPSPGPLAWAQFISPFGPLDDMVWEEMARPALATSAWWLGLGVVGLALASWRLRPSSLRLLDGEPAGRRRSGRRWWVPPVNERRPMLWKELYIERAGSLGRFGRIIGGLLVLGLFLGSTTLAGLIAYATFIRPDEAAVSLYTTWLGRGIADLSVWVRYLITVAIGLRGAVAIASERERGSWDALLTSPLQGGEIVIGKVMGCLNSLRWLIAAALWGWLLSLACGAMAPKEFAYELSMTLAAGTLMATVGVRVSLTTATATRAMATTAGLWLALSAGLWLTAGVILFVVLMIAMFSIMILAQYGLATNAMIGRAANAIFSDGWKLLHPTLYFLAAAGFIAECRLRFDRIAGRIAGGTVAVQVDQFFHGTPTGPVLIGPVPEKEEGAEPEPLAVGDEAGRSL